MESLESLTRKVCEVARKAGRFITDNRKADMAFEEKSRHDYVTTIDKGSEQLIVSMLSEILPEADFIAEEGTGSQHNDNSTSRKTWIIDPLDGTTNFIQGFPIFAVSIALMIDSKPVLGVVYEVNSKECFWAYEGGGAWLNDNPIHVSSTTDWGRAVLITGFVHNDKVKMNVDNIFSLFKEVCLSTSGVRRLGSAATNLAYIAAGRADGFYESGLSPWDVAAGVVLIREAGGTVTDFDGQNLFIEKHEIIASNKPLNEKLRTLINKYR